MWSDVENGPFLGYSAHGPTWESLDTVEEVLDLGARKIGIVGKVYLSEDDWAPLRFAVCFIFGRLLD